MMLERLQQLVRILTMQGTTIGERVHQIRTQRRWSMHQLAERIGTTHSYISQLERGQIRPGIDVVMRLAEAFGMSIDYLVGYAEAGTDAPGPDAHIISEERADYSAGEEESLANPDATPTDSLLASIQRDLHDIAAHDPAALAYILSMVRAIKDKALRDYELRQGEVTNTGNPPDTSALQGSEGSE